VVVNIGACAGWGVIDGFIYAISSSIERNNLRKKLVFVKQVAETKDDLTAKTTLEKIEENLNDTFFSSFSSEGKRAIAKDIIAYAPQAAIEENKVLTKGEVLGWLSIILIYLGVGFLLALPFLLFADKLLAWFISNIAGAAWLFWYGFQHGKSVGKHKKVLGISMSAIGIAFLLISYIAWT
jgi:VIT1/CCC1 family predicted Fe2+/Mn2+ transporter